MRIPFALGIASAFLCAATGCGGTGSGNPTGTVANGPTLTSAASTLLTLACDKLTHCFGSLDSATCQSGIEPQTAFASPLGLAADFGSLQAIIQAEAAGTIHASASVAASCGSDLSALSCSDSSVQSSYSTGAPTDFSHAYLLIPSSCSTLF